MSSAKIPLNVEKAVCEDYEAGMTSSEITLKHGISKSSLHNILKRQSIRIKTPAERNSERDALILEAYNAGKSQRTIADRFCLSQQGVGKILGRYDVAARFRLTEEAREKAISLYQDNWTSRQIGAKLGVHYSSICSLLRSHGVERRSRRKWFFDDNFVLRSDDRVAYWMGFIMADGNIIKARSGRSWEFSLTLNEKDRSLLEELCKDLGVSNDILRTIVRRTPTGNPQSMVSLRLCHKLFQEWFIRWGIVPRKSYNFVTPTIPIECYPGFLRGWFDGDGCLSIREKSSSADIRITGSADGMAWFAEALRHLGFSGKIRIWHQQNQLGGAYILGIHNLNDVSEIHRVLRVRGNIRLDRKWNKLEKLIEERAQKAREHAITKTQLIQAYESGRTEEALKAEFSLGAFRIRKMLLESGIRLRLRSSPVRINSQIEEQVVSAYQKGLKQKDIADKFRLSQPRISTILAKNGVEAIPSHVRRRTNAKKAAIIVQAYNDGRSEKDVASMVGMSIGGVHKVLKRNNVTMRSSIASYTKGRSH